jgi:Mg2+ and Co2+ transporter CorA
MLKRNTSGRNTGHHSSELTRRTGSITDQQQQERKSDAGMEYDKFLSSTSALWTIIDQKRLIALHGLHRRMLEYHNNIHFKDSSMIPMGGEDEEEKELMVVQAIRFSPNKVEKPFTITFGELPRFCQRMKKEQSEHEGGFLWIHIRDLIALDVIVQEFQIHELLAACFQDLRAYSSFVPAFGEMLLSIITCMRENNDFNMYKMYIYVSQHIILTFQAELLPDIMDPELSSPDKLVNIFFNNFLILRPRCLKYGPIYLLYEIAVHTIKAMDSCLEFVSYSLSFFNRVVHLRLLHRERLAILVKMHMISSGIRFFKQFTEENNRNILELLTASLQLVQEIPGGLGHLLAHNSIVQSAHIPYFHDLADIYDFIRTSLTQQMYESLRLETELDATMQLRATNTTIMLSLIATIFLPLTFFAGVYGMNFTIDGGFTIPMLNYSNGPLIFYTMCVGK